LIRPGEIYLAGFPFGDVPGIYAFIKIATIHTSSLVPYLGVVDGPHSTLWLTSFCRETAFKSQGPLACARGSESAATIPRDLLPSRAQRVLRQEALLLRRMAVSRQKPAIGSFEAPPALSVLCPSQRFPRLCG
jgi:hypothetical protein